MSRYVLVLLLASPLLADETASPATGTAALTVTGMSCPNGCPPGVKAAIESQGGVEVEVSFERSRATFRFDPSRTDLAEVRRALLESGFGAELAEPVLVVHEAGGIRIEATTSAASVAVGGEAEIRVRIVSAGQPLSALVVRAAGPANVAGLSSEGRRVEGPTRDASVAETFRVTKKSRARFLAIRLTVSAEGLDEVVVPAILQFDR